MYFSGEILKLKKLKQLRLQTIARVKIVRKYDIGRGFDVCVCVCKGCFSWWSCCLINIKNENVGRGIGLCSDCDACCL
jgi:hypothetical protein